MKNPFNSLKQKWDLGTRDLILVMIAFSCTGTSLLFIRPWLFDAMGLTPKPFWLRALLYPFIMVPIFYGLSLIYGSILGQFDFFWNRLRSRFRKESVEKPDRDPVNS